MKLLFIIGTRPEAIKMAPLIKEARRRRLDPVVCSTAQHREMLDAVFSLFRIAPDHDLDIMRAGQSLSGLTARAVEQIDRIVADEKPDWILVHGDTTSAMAGALVAFYRRVRLAHVEAGLRTNDRARPFPEEINRRIVDLMADAYFAPTELTARNLDQEKVPPERVFITGNTVIDALMDVAEMAYDWENGPLQTVDPEAPIALITAHRRESFGEPFQEICKAIRDLAQRFPDVQFVYPVHLNPNIRQPARHLLSGTGNIKLLDPVDYVSFVQLLKHSCLILTDSGGVQEEGPAFGAPILVMRETTERPEGLDAGIAHLVGTSREKIVSVAERLLAEMRNGVEAPRGKNPYGDGMASIRILDTLSEISNPSPATCSATLEPVADK